MVTDSTKYDTALIIQKMDGSTDPEKLREIMEEVIPDFKRLGINDPDQQHELIENVLATL